MGGSSGGGWSRIGDIRSLEEKAKAALKSNKRNVFISFSHEDMDEVNLLRGQSKNTNSELEFSDYSVKKAFDSDESDYIKRKIREKIQNSSVTIVYLSDNSMNSDWVKWEIEKSKQMGKGIIAVYKGDNKPKNIPDIIKSNVSSIVTWKHEAIMAAIEKAAEER